MPLTQHQTKELGNLIDQRRSALLEELREDATRAREQPYAEHAGIAPDSGDESVATLIADLEQADMTRDLEEFRALEAARDRIKDGGYGEGIDCGNHVGHERLEAVPSALRRVQCPDRHERAYGRKPKP